MQNNSVDEMDLEMEGGLEIKFLIKWKNLMKW